MIKKYNWNNCYIPQQLIFTKANIIMILRFTKYLIIVFLIFNISCTECKQKAFTFVQLCDTQLGMGGYEHDLSTFKQAVIQINELRPDFVVICGDLVHNSDDSSFSDFLNIKEQFKMPCYVAPGNHDIGNIPNDTTLGYYRKTIGKDYFEFKNKGYSVIVTNTQLWKVNIENESEKHDRWFKETLQNSSIKQLPVIVIGHFPLFIESPNEEEKYFNIPLRKRLEILDLFRQNNVKAYLSGHTHKTLINNYQDIQLVTGETTSKNFDERPFGFRLWQVSADTVSHSFIPLDTQP